MGKDVRIAVRVTAKGKDKIQSKGPKMRAEHNRICEAKSVGVRAEIGSTRRSFCLP